MHAHLSHSEPGFLLAHVVARELASSWHWQQPLWQPEGSRNPGSKGRRLLWLQPELTLLEAGTRFSNEALTDQELKGFLICGE